MHIYEVTITATAHEYYAVAGGRISMPCNITAPSSDDVVTLVLWYKGDMKVPIYTLDARKGPIEKSKHFPSKQLGRRVHFDLHVRNPGLTIDPVKGEDQGIYRCRVEYKRNCQAKKWKIPHSILYRFPMIVYHARSFFKDCAKKYRNRFSDSK
ncbi:uncharacterized protein TNIN_243981 [Trichonephila inaurata madagascariensis]|uniref:Ig-like domain-containing protein n=1 Tax=Trichonephila inaurata madagascariensis TaxID=2747483 RepID=A0A8X6WU74_9ARAC|nr:uncharacterized protein TNIN_243981 [Trichonephila inaurata madagascariensis]